MKEREKAITSLDLKYSYPNRYSSVRLDTKGAPQLILIH